jgi:hypothetical protein
MFTILFSILVVVAVLSSCSELMMRIRVTTKEDRDKIAWWRGGSDEVVAIYQGLFPNSRLPLFRRFVFWLLIAWAVAILLTFLWKAN